MAGSMGEGWRMMEVQGSPSAPKPKSRVVGEGKSGTRNQVNGGVSALSSSSKAKARHILLSKQSLQLEKESLDWKHRGAFSPPASGAWSPAPESALEPQREPAHILILNFQP